MVAGRLISLDGGEKPNRKMGLLEDVTYHSSINQNLKVKFSVTETLT